MRLVASAACLVVMGGLASARPPTTPDFVRIDRLLAEYTARIDELRRAEEFAAKSREEKLVLYYREGRAEYEGKKLTAAYVAEEIFEKWKAVQVETPRQEDFSTLLLLPDAFKVRFQAAVLNRTVKEDRFRASKTMVDALLHDHLHIRQIAFRCLEAIYTATFLYDPNASRGDRSAKQKKWREHIDKMRR
ncbi:MAG: hypothetical protein ACT4PV_00825 [Planctomycetaceae bacterium]